MAVEARRGCGFRKVGGLYLVGGGTAVACDRLPIVLDVCPTCGHGIKQARGWTWIDVAALVHGVHPNCQDNFPCPLCMATEAMGKAGLLWIGERFYKTPQDFISEGNTLGLSRRIKAIPKGFKIGETWILLAHPKTIWKQCECGGSGLVPALTDRGEDGGTQPVACEKCKGHGGEFIPGIFRVWKPTRIECLFKESERGTEKVSDAEKRGITPVFVPDNDKDHQGSVYDEEEDTLPLGDAPATPDRS